MEAMLRFQVQFYSILLSKICRGRCAKGVFYKKKKPRGQKRYGKKYFWTIFHRIKRQVAWCTSRPYAPIFKAPILLNRARSRTVVESVPRSAEMYHCILPVALLSVPMDLFLSNYSCTPSSLVLLMLCEKNHITREL